MGEERKCFSKLAWCLVERVLLPWRGGVGGGGHSLELWGMEQGSDHSVVRTVGHRGTLV